MLTNTALYAVKKRKKPVQKIPKPSPPDGAKSNPSKRHRDRLNGELDKLTSLLPFTDEVRARLDKLSVLRLSVGYLKVKNFFNATLKKGQNGSSWSSDRSLMFGGNALTPSSTSSSVTSPCSSQVTSIDGVSFSEGELLLQALNGFVLVVTAEGYVFYASPTIQDFLGFHQSDVVHQSVFELIHTDDRALFRRQLHFALKQMSQQDSSPENPSEQGSSKVTSNLMTYDPQSVPPENSSFLERNFCCRFRCLLDNSSGFLALNFHGRLKFLHGQHHLSDDGTLVPPQLALFTIATPLQPPSILEIRTKTLIFQTKHKLDFTPMGIDSRGKVVLGYSEVELCTRGSGYHFIHAADMMYCADNHLRMMKTGDSGFTVFRLLSKSRTWIWVQASARVVFKGGKPDFIVARQRALTNEEGEEQLRLRRLQLPFNFATGEAMLYDLAPTVDVPADSCSAPKQRKMETNSISHDSILGCMLSQDQSIYCEHNASAINDAAFRDSHATVSVPGDIWKMPSPKSSTGLVKPEATVQDMMETLQQILGDSELSETLDVCPEELKSWESTLLKMGGSGELGSEDLNDFFSHDILSYVEEQLQKDGGLKILDHLDDVAPCLSVMDLQGDLGPGLVPGVEQDFSWHLDSQDQTRPHAAAAGLNGPTLQQIADMAPPMTFDPSLVDSCAQTQNQLRTLRVSGADGGDLGVFPVQNHLRQPADVQLNSVFHFQGNRGNQWNADVFNQNLPAAAGFVSDPAPSSCLQQNRFQAQNSSETQNPSWSPLMSNGHQPAGACINQMPGFHRNPQNSMFRTAETSQFQQVQQGLEQPPPSSCMFRNAAAPSAPVNGVQLGQPPSCPRLNPAAAQVPTKPSCFYQGLPGVGGVPGLNAAAVPDPEAAQLSCQMTGGLDPDGLMPYLDFTEQTQITSCPVVGNGGFPSSSSSLANGNAFYSEKQIGISHCESWTANDATLGLKHQFKGN